MQGLRLVLVLMLVPGCGLLANDGWNRFRGPNGSGIVAGDHKLPTELNKPLWETALSEGHSSPVIWGDRIFVTGKNWDSLETICLNRKNGKILWRKTIPQVSFERVHRVNSLATPTPVTDGERVYAYFGSYGLVAYDMNGEEIWQRTLKEQRRNIFGAASSPMLAGEYLIFTCENQSDSFVEALDRKTGKVVWHQQRDFKSSWSTPVLHQNGGTQELLVYSVYWLTALDLKDGSDRWSVPGLADEPAVTPVMGGGLVYVSSYNMKTNTEVIGLPTYASLLEDYDSDKDGVLSFEEGKANKSVLSRHDADGEGDHPLRIFYRMLDQNSDEQISSDEYDKLVAWVNGFEQENGLVAIKPAAKPGDKAEIVWRHRVGVPEIPSPLYYDGRIYLVKNGGIVTCLDATSGEKKYRARLEAGGPYYASPVVGDGKIYTASARGVVSVFR